MRPVKRGTAPKTYSDYKDARNDLADRLGWYCSYCEMPVKNMIEVEHVIPKSHPPYLELDWDNFLLSCRYCNGVKRNRNLGRNGYVWPDQDNTDFVFDYDEINVISPKSGLAQTIEDSANETIDLMGLNRLWGGAEEPTEADTRPFSRQEAWFEARASLNRWRGAPIQLMAEQIGATAVGFGHFSIWCTVFHSEQPVIDAIRNAFRGTFRDTDPVSGHRIVRPNGQI